MASILKKAANYKRISTVLCEGEAHLRDPYTPAPVILKPPAPKAERHPDDVTDFPAQKIVPIPEAIPYQEGKYRPASVPLVQGYFPYTQYLQAGKVYNWCSCGIGQNSPWCDSMCNQTVTRNRPVYFNVSETGYYKICQCKLSANAPFCNGACRQYFSYYTNTFKGRWEFWGNIAYWASWGYLFWNFYS